VAEKCWRDLGTGAMGKETGAMTPMEPSVPCAREEALLIEELPDELLVYDLERHRAHTLNRTAALVWRQCDGRTTIAEMAARLHRELDLPADERVVWMALARLQRAHLLQERIATPGSSADYTRRALLRKLALAGGLTLLLPAVQSIVAPTVADAATVLTTHECSQGGHTGQCCTILKNCPSPMTGQCHFVCNGSNCHTPPTC
jgi:Coenzyme PQQ synthesis protein D (PqqD)